MGAFPSIPTVSCVPRARLMRAMEEWHRARVILMVAPAGFGKSTTAMLWLRQEMAADYAPRAAWVSLNPTFDTPERFVELVGTHLEPFLPAVREAIQLGNTGDFPIEQVLTAILVEIARCERRVVLVLDDLHVIESDAVLVLIQSLIDHAPENLRLVLLSRSRPRLQFSRILLSSAMLQFGIDDLAFDHDEFVQFARTRWSVADIKQEALDSIEARTRGWPAGLQLLVQALPATLSLSEVDLEAISAMADLWEYLESEILRRMPERMQQLLVQSSLLPFLSVDLCAALLGWSTDEVEQVLESAARSNSLITSFRSRTSASMSITYRVHPVLQEYLQRRLFSTYTKVQIGVQQRRAAEWLATNHNVDMALALLRPNAETDVSAADVTCAAEIVERMSGQALQQMELTSIKRWAAHLSSEALLAHPRLALNMAWSARYMESSEMSVLTERAGRALAMPSNRSEAESRVMYAELHVLEANCRFVEGRLDAAEEALQAAFALDPDPNGSAYAYAHLMGGYLNSGVQRSLDERIRSFRIAAKTFEKLGFTRGCIEAYKFEVLARRRVADVAGAIEAGETLIRYAEAHGWMRSNAAIEGMLYHGESLYFSGAVRPAQECLQHAAVQIVDGENLRLALRYQLQLRIQLCRLVLGESVDVDPIQDDLEWTRLIVAKGLFVAGNCAYARMLRDLRMGHPERCRSTVEVMPLSLADVSASQAPNIVRAILAAEVFPAKQTRGPSRCCAVFCSNCGRTKSISRNFRCTCFWCCCCSTGGERTRRWSNSAAFSRRPSGRRWCAW